MIQTLPSNMGGGGAGMSLIPGWGAKILHVSQAENQNINRGNIVTDWMKTLKLVHIKK